MNQTANAEDELLAALKKAAANRVGPDRIEEVVGQEALLHTLRAPGREALRLADIAPDPECQTTAFPNLRDAAEVAYWDRGWTAEAGKIAGLVWRSDGSVEVFCGLIYPP